MTCSEKNLDNIQLLREVRVKSGSMRAVGSFISGIVYFIFLRLHERVSHIYAYTHTRKIRIILPDFSIFGLLRVGVRASRRRRCAKG